MRLIIAEKPSLARAIAAALAGNAQRVGHHLQCASGDVIAWCAGHVLELAPPEDYSAGLKAWSLETLPILPSTWRHRVTARELVDSLRRLLAKASRVVHAGDPDREGQLLVDEVLLHVGWRGPTERLLINDLSPDAVRRALAALEPNERYQALYDEALARQRADWLYGINLTRLYTVRGRLSGYRGVVSVGRVQTPVLGLIVRRDQAIEGFVPKPFFVVQAGLQTSSGDELVADWAVGEERAGLVDEEGRLLDRSVAAAVAAKVAGQGGVVTEHEVKPHSEAPPLPYSLATLQIDVGRKLGLSAARVLELAQALYERQLLTYPRSDCSHLPEGQFVEAREVMAAVLEHAPALGAAYAAANLRRRSRAWADSKVTAHHAIIPTAHRARCPLDDSERALYELVARRYVQQFLLSFDYRETRVGISLGGETFVARGRQSVALGWRAIEERLETTEDDADEAAEQRSLPPVVVGERLQCASSRVLDKRTQPPKAFTDATLIQAMCNIARFVSNPQARKILQDTDGIGTPATRAVIIETLFERGYVERRKKQIRSTTVGRALIAALPAVATAPDLTAVWESGMQRITTRQLQLDQFLGGVTAQLRELVQRGKAGGALPLPIVPPVPGKGLSRSANQRSGRGSRRLKGAPQRARGRAL
jgi:DNA topoisomerase III